MVTVDNQYFVYKSTNSLNYEPHTESVQKGKKTNFASFNFLRIPHHIFRKRALMLLSVFERGLYQEALKRAIKKSYLATEISATSA